MREIAGSQPIRAHNDGPEDVDLPLVLAAQRDRTEFGVLYRKYASSIYRFCYRRLGDQQAAEDATSRTFERALKALPKFRQGSFRAWLFAIARNTVTDTYRRERQPGPLPEGWDRADHQPGPEERAITNEGNRSLAVLLGDLNPDQRTVVELRLEGFTNQEIAQVMNRSSGSVRTLQYRALTIIRHRLTTLDEPHPGFRESNHETH